MKQSKKGKKIRLSSEDGIEDSQVCVAGGSGSSAVFFTGNCEIPEGDSLHLQLINRLQEMSQFSDEARYVLQQVCSSSTPHDAV